MRGWRGGSPGRFGARSDDWVERLGALMRLPLIAAVAAVAVQMAVERE